MTHTKPLSRRAFTLVELLTVISIIALLMGLLLPSLARARAQAKKVKVQTQLEAIAKGLEMFRNDHKDQYPDSRPLADWVSGVPNTTGNGPLYGAHWLARAMVGYDLQGVDVDFRQLDGPAISHNELQSAERLKPYITLESAKVVPDSDVPGASGTGINPTGRYVMLEDYGFPILYYRANPTGKALLARRADVNPPNTPPAIYYQEDNELFTGSNSLSSWQFKGLPHRIKNFGNLSNVDQPDTFLNYFHNHDVHKATESGGTAVITPYNAETFILLSAGEDGVYGTRDDVKNFKMGS